MYIYNYIKLIFSNLYRVSIYIMYNITVNYYLATDLISKLLTVDPTKRISTADALFHPWMKVWKRHPQLLDSLLFLLSL